MKTFVLGDIHGTYKALTQCLTRSGFDYAKDRLIVLGDVCDGYPQVKECIRELLKIKHCIYVIGNHDLWVLDWAKEGTEERDWLTQGGYNTIKSYAGKKMPKKHVALLKDSYAWYEDDAKRLFVHGGFDPDKPIKNQRLEFLVWDRELLYDARERSVVDKDFRYDGYKEIFIGHTTTETFGTTEPLKMGNVWALDTGAGWSGKLTIMDVATKQYWQSDPSPELYPETNPRR